LPPLTLPTTDGELCDPITGANWTVLFCFPGAYVARDAYPTGWGDIPGATGCTLEAKTFQHRLGEFDSVGARVVGVSTQRPEDQLAFVDHALLQYPLLSDQELRFAASLRLPTFRAGGRHHLKRLTLVVDAERRIRHALYPIADPAASVDRALSLVASSRRRSELAEVS
jgi:peroxiredoxin